MQFIRPNEFPAVLTSIKNYKTKEKALGQVELFPNYGDLRSENSNGSLKVILGCLNLHRDYSNLNTLSNKGETLLKLNSQEL